MSVWAVVPIKALAHAKRRLTPALDAAGRQRLTRTMVRDVLEALRATRGLSGIAVVTSERSLVPPGMRRIEDCGEGLNAALRRAAALLEAEGATAVLTLAADVPLTTRDEIEAVLAAGRRTPVVVVPDRQQRGTNALLLAPPTLLAPAFGEASLARHVELAEAQGIEPAILRLSGLGLDVDDVAALEDLRRATAGRSGYGFLRAALQVVP
jgi:2-phospho-L-lactate guanylyltransferase